MPTELILPSGLTGQIRELGVDEENILSNPRFARSGKSLHKTFEACWLETTDAGIYDFGEKVFDPTKLLQGDGVALLVYLRIESQGSQYFFDVNCPQCGERIPWEVDLLEYLDLNLRKLPNATKKILVEGNGMFEGHFPRCKKDYKFRLLTLKDELRFPQIRRQNPDKMSSVLLDMAISKIDGVDHKKAFLGLEEYPHKFEGPEEKLSSHDANHVRQHIEEVNCGLETTFHVECSVHGEVPVELPFREDFLLPKKRG